MTKKDEKRQAKEEKRAQKAERRKQRRKAQAVLSRGQIAEQLRSLASQVDSGTFVLGDTELDLPAYADFQIRYKVKKAGGDQIQVAIEWGSPTSAPILPTE